MNTIRSNRLATPRPFRMPLSTGNCPYSRPPQDRLGSQRHCCSAVHALHCRPCPCNCAFLAGGAWPRLLLRLLPRLARPRRRPATAGHCACTMLSLGPARTRTPTPSFALLLLKCGRLGRLPRTFCSGTTSLRPSQSLQSPGSGHTAQARPGCPQYRRGSRQVCRPHIEICVRVPGLRGRAGASVRQLMKLTPHAAVRLRQPRAPPPPFRPAPRDRDQSRLARRCARLSGRRWWGPPRGDRARCHEPRAGRHRLNFAVNESADCSRTRTTSGPARTRAPGAGPRGAARRRRCRLRPNR